jgi:hypothetical protein
MFKAPHYFSVSGQSLYLPFCQDLADIDFDSVC